MSEPSAPLERNARVTPIRPHEYPEQELENQYPTKPFGAVAGPGETATPASTSPSVMDLASAATGRPEGGPGAAPTGAQLSDQANQLLTRSKAFQDELVQRFPDLSDGQKSLLTAKLSKYQSSAGKAASLLGAAPISTQEKEEVLKVLKEKGHPSGLVQFLSMVSSGDSSTRAVTAQIGASPGGKLNPIDMLKAQYALAAASKSVNFATAVVGQGVNFFKTVMQTQI